MEKLIIKIEDYGKIKFHLRELMDKQNINRNQLATAISADYAVISKWYRGEVIRIDTDILARICYVLNCQVQDILTYEDEKQE